MIRIPSADVAIGSPVHALVLAESFTSAPGGQAITGLERAPRRRSSVARRSSPGRQRCSMSFPLSLALIRGQPNFPSFLTKWARLLSARGGTAFPVSP